ncbi:MAG: HEPN domain-containing protein [Patescibacteria group bacterium]
MKHQTEEAERWLKQARHEIEAAQADLEHAFFSDACYSAEQAAQKALKGYLYLKGSRMVWKHSVKELLDECATYDSQFAALIDAGRILDQYYIPTRYPDALAPPAVPFESYTETQAREAIALAQNIVTQVEQSGEADLKGNLLKN